MVRVKTTITKKVVVDGDDKTTGMIEGKAATSKEGKAAGSTEGNAATSDGKPQAPSESQAPVSSEAHEAPCEGGTEATAEGEKAAVSQKCTDGKPSCDEANQAAHTSSSYEHVLCEEPAHDDPPVEVYESDACSLAEEEDETCTKSASDAAGKNTPEGGSQCHERARCANADLPIDDKESKKELGRRGELAAARFLERNNYRIIERNWKCFAGEADIIASDGEAIVFVEVKTRRGTEKGFPAEAVTRKKRDRYEKIALAYLQDHYFDESAVRFDVISIVVLPGDRAFMRHHIGAYSVEA
jgi:uncharacterized protein (TIGR00252 family)